MIHKELLESGITSKLLVLIQMLLGMRDKLLDSSSVHLDAESIYNVNKISLSLGIVDQPSDFFGSRH
jgi:hypothetical protein